jgi:hypothetical protein
VPHVDQQGLLVEVAELDKIQSYTPRIGVQEGSILGVELEHGSIKTYVGLGALERYGRETNASRPHWSSH